TLDGQHYAQDRRKLLFPLVFCRECGQEYYLVEWHRHARQLKPRSPLPTPEEGSDQIRDGYFLLDGDSENPIWIEEDAESLPDNWFNYGKSGQRTSPKAAFAAFIPQRLYVSPTGDLLDEPSEDTVPGWFLPRPFLSCLHCG